MPELAPGDGRLSPPRTNKRERVEEGEKGKKRKGRGGKGEETIRLLNVLSLQGNNSDWPKKGEKEGRGRGVCSRQSWL